MVEVFEPAITAIIKLVDHQVSAASTKGVKIDVSEGQRAPRNIADDF
jgi:hypothetical protein